jgi:hypothetical protein
MRSLAVSLQFSIPQPLGAATPIHAVIMSEEAILSSLLIRSSQNTMNDIPLYSYCQYKRSNPRKPFSLGSFARLGFALFPTLVFATTIDLCS